MNGDGSEDHVTYRPNVYADIARCHMRPAPSVPTMYHVRPGTGT